MELEALELRQLRHEAGADLQKPDATDIFNVLLVKIAESKRPQRRRQRAREPTGRAGR